MGFVGGGGQKEYVVKTRGLHPHRRLLAGVAVGKYEALCLIADHRGEIFGEPVPFPLTEPGTQPVDERFWIMNAAPGRCR